jgi:hypothetical protein
MVGYHPDISEFRCPAKGCVSTMLNATSHMRYEFWGNGVDESTLYVDRQIGLK